MPVDNDIICVWKPFDGNYPWYTERSTMILSTRTLLTSFIGLTVFSAFSVFAQNTPPQGGMAPQKQGEAKTVLISDVTLTDVKMKMEKGKVTGTFSLRSEQGSQSNVVYGVMVTTAGKDTFYSKELGSVPTLFEKQLVMQALSFDIPPYIEGKSSLVLTVMTRDGLPLGKKVVATSTLVATTKSTFSCAKVTKSATSSISCTTTEPLTVTYQRDFFSSPVSEHVVTPQNGKALIDHASVSPGNYVVTVTSSDKKESHSYYAMVPGSFGTIKGVTINDRNDGIDIATILALRAAPGATLVATLQKQNGSTCVTTTVPVQGLTSIIHVTKPCREGTVSLVLKNSAGETLDTYTAPFSVAPYTTQQSAPSHTAKLMTTLYVAFTVIAIFVFMGVYFFRKKSLPVTPALGAIIAFMFTMMPMHADATTLATWRNINDDSEFSWSCYAYFDPSQASFTTSETVSLDITLDMYVNPWAEGSGNCTAEVESGFVGDNPVESGGPGSIFMMTNYAWYTGSLGSVYGLGTHTLNISSSLSPLGGGNGGFGAASVMSAAGTVDFVVSNPVVPTVNLYFSTLLESLQDFFAGKAIAAEGK